MPFTGEIGKLLSSENSAPYLEVAVKKGTPQEDVNAIVEAISTISLFFRVKFDIGGNGGGSAQKGLVGSRSTITQQSSEATKDGL